MRFGTAIAVTCIAISLSASAQTPANVRQTAELVQSWQNPDGGFGASKGAKSSLGTTSSAIRILKNVGGSIPEISLCRAYVASCFDPATGGFASEPGGKPGVSVTAIGLMAAAELGIANDAMIEGAIGYFGREADEIEEIRIAVAGLEAVKKPSPDFPKWIAKYEADQLADGSWGEGGAKPRMTGSYAAGLLRMGASLKNKDAIVKTLKEGQRPDGGWSRDGTTSDLETSYRIMRALFMMKEKPDLDALKAYLAKHRQNDGAYESAPGKNDGAGTYYVTTVNRWARILSGEPAIVETAGFTTLFDGKSLDGWEGETSHWSVKDGVLVGTSPGLKENTFLATTKNYEDFILKLTFRLTGEPNANSGVQFRSVRIPGHEMSGYQADIGQGFWGCLYDESRRNKVLVDSSAKAKASVNLNGWNHYVIRCMGNHITLSLNGETSVDYFEKEDGIARGGKIAVQIHAGGPMQIEFKDILIQPLPIPMPQTDDSETAGFHLRTLKASGRKYAVHLPNGYDPAKEYPVILFLHGSGERGDNGISQTQAGIGPILAANPERLPAIVVLPQARKTWAADSEDIADALAALDEVTARHKTDSKRVYLTGLSMGGFGAWGLAAKYPDRFAAVVPVCGFGDRAWAKSLKTIPIWTFVGDEDNVRILGETRGLVDALKSEGGSPRITEYRAVGHNSWDRAYSDPDLMAWLLSQHK